MQKKNYFVLLAFTLALGNPLLSVAKKKAKVDLTALKTDSVNADVKKIKKDATGKLIWECPKCGNRDQSKMHVARRTCGYIGTQYWNQGRTQEIAERVLHL